MDLLDIVESESLFMMLKNSDKQLQQIILMRFYGYEVEEISKLLNIKPDTIYKKIQRFKEKMNKHWVFHIIVDKLRLIDTNLALIWDDFDSTWLLLYLQGGMAIMEGVEEFILSLCDEIMLAYQFGFVKGLEISIDTGKQLSREGDQ